MLSLSATPVPSISPTEPPSSSSAVPRTLPLPPRRPSYPRRATSPSFSPPSTAPSPGSNYIHLPPVEQLILRTTSKGSKSQGSSPVVADFGGGNGTDAELGGLQWDLERALLVGGQSRVGEALTVDGTGGDDDDDTELGALELARRASDASPLEPLPPFPLPLPLSASVSSTSLNIVPLPLPLPLALSHPPPALAHLPLPVAEGEGGNGEAFDFEPFVERLDLVAREREREAMETQGAGPREDGGEGEGRLLPEFEEFVQESFQLGSLEGPRRSLPPPPLGADDSPLPRPPPLAPLMTPSSTLPFPTLSTSTSSASLLGPFPLPAPLLPPHQPRHTTTTSSASYQSFDLIDLATPSTSSPVPTGRKMSLATAAAAETGSGRRSLRIEIPTTTSVPPSAVDPPFTPSPSLADASITRYQLSDVGVTPIEEQFSSSLPLSTRAESEAGGAESEEGGGGSSEDFEGFEYAASNISGYEDGEEKKEEEEDVTLHSTSAAAVVLAAPIAELEAPVFDDSSAFGSEDEEEEEEEEDPDTHPLYTLLSTSLHPALRSLWDSSTLLLVPPRRSLPPSFELLSLPPPPTPGTPTTSPARGLGFEFVRGGKGVEPRMSERTQDVEERERRERMREEGVRWCGWHCFKPESEAQGGGLRWRSVGGGETEGFVRVRLEPERGVAHVEWVTSATEAEGSLPPPPTLPAARADSANSSPTTPTASSYPPDDTTNLTTPTTRSVPFPPIEPRISSDSEASSLLPHTPPSPLASQPPPAIHASSSSDEGLATPTEPAFKPAPLPPPTLTLPTPSEPRPLSILAETTIYRRPRPSPAPAPIITPPPPPKSSGGGRSGFRAPKWLRRGVGMGMGGGSSLKVVAEERGKVGGEVEKGKQPMLERVRVMSVDQGVVAEGWDFASPSQHQPSAATNEHPTTSNLGRKAHHSSSTSLLLTRSLSRHPSFDLTSAAGGRRRASSMASTRSGRSTRSGLGAAVGGAGAGVATPGGERAAERDFQSDLAFFALPPPHLASLGPILASTLRLVRSLVRDFEGSFAYIKGFDVYTVQRIRKGIFDKAWIHLSRELMGSGDLGVRLVNEEQTTLLLLLENVTLGLLHSKIYLSSVLPLYTTENHHLNHLLALYRSRHPSLTPADLGVDVCDFGRGEALEGAVAAMRKIGDGGMGEGVKEVVRACEGVFGEGTRRLLEEARTPLGCIGCMRLAIEEIVKSVKEVEVGLRVAPDDLIPLLAWVTVQSGVEDLESLLYFVKTFRLSDMLAPEFDWSFVTFQASLAFLLSDPLNALASSPLPPPPTILFPSASASPNPSLRASDLPSFRPRHSSVHQQSPYATAEQRRSPPSSPRSLRTISSAGRTSPAASRGHHHRAEPLESSTSSHSSHHSTLARERRQSWQPGTRSTRRESVSPSPSAVDGRARGERMTASEQMPPPSWTTSTTKHQRRQSLGVLPSSSSSSALGSPFFLDSRALHESSIPEGHYPSRSSPSDSPSSDVARTRTTSVASSSPAQELQIRPRIVLPPRSAQSSFHRPYTPSNERVPNTPPLLRSQSNVSSRKIGPVSTSDSADMRRSESEGSPTVKRTPHADVWSLWGGSAGPSSPGSSERAVSPAASDRTSAAAGDDQSWWTWGRERLNSVGPSLALASPSLGGPTIPQTAPLDSRSVDDSAFPGPRARRHSASAADMLGFTRTLSLPVEPPSSSSARLAAILAARNGGTTRPRPRSIMSVSSISSLESGASHSTALEEYMTAPTTMGSSTASLPVPSRRRPTKSRTWRELPTSNLTSKPLAPQLDSSSVISFPTTATPSRSSSSASASSRASPLPPQAFALPPSPRPSPRPPPPGSPLQRRHTEL